MFSLTASDRFYLYVLHLGRYCIIFFEFNGALSEATNRI